MKTNSYNMLNDLRTALWGLSSLGREYFIPFAHCKIV